MSPAVIMLGYPCRQITLKIDLDNGNAGRSGTYFKSNSRRKLYESLLRVGKYVTKYPYTRPMRLRITRILGPKQRLWDADSVLRGSVKELIDSLVAVGWFKDDGPECISLVVGQQNKSQRHNGPAVMIEVFTEGESE